MTEQHALVDSAGVPARVCLSQVGAQVRPGEEQPDHPHGPRIPLRSVAVLVSAVKGHLRNSMLKVGEGAAALTEGRVGVAEPADRVGVGEGAAALTEGRVDVAEPED